MPPPVTPQYDRPPTPHLGTAASSAQLVAVSSVPALAPLPAQAASEAVTGGAAGGKPERKDQGRCGVAPGSCGAQRKDKDADQQQQQQQLHDSLAEAQQRGPLPLLQTEEGLRKLKQHGALPLEVRAHTASWPLPALRLCLSCLALTCAGHPCLSAHWLLSRTCPFPQRNPQSSNAGMLGARWLPA